MHTHKQTLMSRMSAQEKDRKDPKHDAACTFVAQEHILLRLAAMVFPKIQDTKKEFVLENRYGRLPCASRAHPPSEGPRITHSVILNGKLAPYTQIKTELEWVVKNPRTNGVQGFIDVFATVEHGYAWRDRTLTLDPTENCPTYEFNEGRDVPPLYRMNVPEEFARELEFRLYIEVKTNPETLGTMLRQIKTYRESAIRSGYWVLVTTYDLPDTDVAVLGSQNIWYVRLGSEFDAYCAERDKSVGQARLTL